MKWVLTASTSTWDVRIVTWKTGRGAGLIKYPEAAKDIIAATRKGAGATHLSQDAAWIYRNEIETWIPELLETGLAAITIHGRTRKEMSKVPAHWDLIGRVAEIAKGSGTLILGNGDVETCEDARVKCKEYGVDGVMIGRGVFGNPWLFSDRIDVTLNERLSILVEHTTLFEELLGSHKSFDIMKKHYKAYVTGFDGAKELRVSLMACSTAGEVAQIVKEFCPEVKGF